MKDHRGSISSSAWDQIALKPCTWISGDDRHGTYRIRRGAESGQGALDLSYDVCVEFEVGGTATIGNDGSTGDYHLTKNRYGGVLADILVVNNKKGSVVIPAGQDYIDVYVMPNGDSLFEPDETVTLTVKKAYIYGTDASVSSNLFKINSTGGTVAIYQAPEFLSDKDPAPRPNPLPISDDTYKSYIKHKATAGTSISFLPQSKIDAQKNHAVKYSIVSGNESGLFKIDENTGLISAKVNLKDRNLQASYQLRIRVYDAVRSQLYDEATVPIVISEWKVLRDHQLQLAQAIPTDGCTIQELADEIGLNVGEFKNWLTTNYHSLRLFDDSVIAITAIDVNKVLSGNQSFSHGYQSLAVPNVIYSVWFGDDLPAMRKNWEENNQKLESLGFFVAIHDNDYWGIRGNGIPQNENMRKMLLGTTYANNSRNSFFAKLDVLINSKALHGFFHTGHGGTKDFARVTSQVASHADDAARIANKVDNLAKVTSKVEGVIDVGIPVQLTPELRAALITSQDVIAHTSLIGAEARGVTQIIVGGVIKQTKHADKMISAVATSTIPKNAWIIKETLQGTGKITSKYVLTENEAIELGLSFLRHGYKEIGKPGSGVYRSSNNLRQFRIDANSLNGLHDPYVPHIHIEVFDPSDINKPFVNNHIILQTIK